jgi:hypothetical protein
MAPPDLGRRSVQGTTLCLAGISMNGQTDSSTQQLQFMKTLMSHHLKQAAFDKVK